MEKAKPKISKATEPNGWDYGVLPRFLVMANPALPELWQAAKCDALGFFFLPNVGGEREVPAVALRFDSIAKGREFFDILRGLDNEPGSGRGSNISFIQDPAHDCYTIVIGINEEELIERTVGRDRQEDYTINVATVTVTKEFSLSERFQWLRRTSAAKPIFFAPASQSGTDFEAGFLKRNTVFSDRESLSRESIEYYLTAQGNDDGEETHFPPPPVIPAEIESRRKRQLDRFFPITLARLPFNTSYQAVATEIKSHFREWQILQAACNLTCPVRFSELTQADGTMNWDDVYEALRHHPESADSDVALRHKFYVTALREQITEDARYLAAHLAGPDAGPDPFEVLTKFGVLVSP